MNYKPLPKRTPEEKKAMRMKFYRDCPTADCDWYERMGSWGEEPDILDPDEAKAKSSWEDKHLRR